MQNKYYVQLKMEMNAKLKKQENVLQRISAKLEEIKSKRVKTGDYIFCCIIGIDV